MNILKIKEEFEKYIKNNNIKYSSNLFTLSIYNILKNSNYGKIIKNIELKQNKNNISISVIDDIDLIFNDTNNSFINVSKHDNTNLFNKKNEEFLNFVKDSLFIDNYQDLKNFCSNENFKSILSEDLYNNVKTISSSEIESNYIYYMQSIYYFFNTSEEDKIKGFGEINEDTLFTDYCFLITSLTPKHLDQIIKLNFKEDNEKLLFDNEFLNPKLEKLVSIYISNFIQIAVDNIKIKDLKIFLNEEDLLRILIDSKSKEDFLNKSFPILNKIIKEDLISVIDLQIKRNSSIYELYLEAENFEKEFKKLYPDLYRENIELEELIEKNKNISNLDFLEIGFPKAFINHNVLKTSILKDNNIFSNYFLSELPILQIYSDFDDLNGNTVINPKNFIDTGNEELITEAFIKYFNYCEKNNYIVNPSYKIKLESNTPLSNAFNKALLNFPNVIVNNYSKNHQVYIDLLNTTDISIQEINKIKNIGVIESKEEVIDKIKKKSIKIDKNK